MVNWGWEANTVLFGFALSLQSLRSAIGLDKFVDHPSTEIRDHTIDLPVATSTNKACNSLTAAVSLKR
jgi:hypothetical protein